MAREGENLPYIPGRGTDEKENGVLSKAFFWLQPQACACAFRFQNFDEILEPRGFEPLTSSMPLRRSTN